MHLARLHVGCFNQKLLGIYMNKIVGSWLVTLRQKNPLVANQSVSGCQPMKMATDQFGVQHPQTLYDQNSHTEIGNHRNPRCDHLLPFWDHFGPLSDSPFCVVANWSQGQCNLCISQFSLSPHHSLLTGGIFKWPDESIYFLFPTDQSGGLISASLSVTSARPLFTAQ